MPFATILKNLVGSIPGASGAILADWEGEAVAHFCLYDEFELKVIGAHKGIILNQMKNLHDNLSAGRLREAVISTDRQHIIVSAIGSEYSLVMTLDRNAVIGRALYGLRNVVTLLEREIY